ncbi:DUF547 domain-containing protein [Parvularcula flava]|uniref:DUF547 domain-containing protein n=1 Tax=Aquisalinus luteolus TaxID=1566827 RepID=A0A8J3A0D8_9PROT|nr:DUF547 domain-containing protein [Aquisalinus luteolus]NHK26649.1 DUF547 domain-containing protein [Aquisalinus luteolus]GGH92985.1 DUF547 domain-containing protein [Aquisalinus luteolus]
MRFFANLFSALILLVATSADAGEETYSRFLDTFVVEQGPGVTSVRYGEVTDKDRDALKAWIESQAVAGPPEDRDAAFAWWVNLYNAVTLDVVLDNYPVDSIRDIRFGFGLRPGPWREDLVAVNGEAMSLDDIEHGTLREEWDEPRVHFAVNCASIGCPALLPEPFAAETLETQLDTATRAFVNSGRAVQVDEGGDLILSSIFQWYGEDFGDNDRAILDWLRFYAEGDTAAMLDGRRKIDGYAYDWSLNEAE